MSTCGGKWGAAQNLLTGTPSGKAVGGYSRPFGTKSARKLRHPENANIHDLVVKKAGQDFCWVMQMK